MGISMSSLNFYRNQIINNDTSQYSFFLFFSFHIGAKKGADFGLQEEHIRHQVHSHRWELQYNERCEVTAWRFRLHWTSGHHSLVPQDLPGRLDVCVQVLLRGFPTADPVARVIVGEHVAVDPGAEADVETAHLAQIHGVAVGKQQRVATVRGAADKHASDPVPAAAPSVQNLHGVQLALGVLPVGAVTEVQAGHPAGIGVQRVGGLGRQEGELGCNATGTRWAAEEPAQFAEGKAIHPGALRRHLRAREPLEWLRSGAKRARVS